MSCERCSEHKELDPGCTMEDDYDYPQTLQEELNEILEAFYSMISEEEIRKYQSFVEGIKKQKIAEAAVKAPSLAPDFELFDQDNEKVHLKTLLEKGPVVMTFYRGKWCPHCNATIMRLQQCLDQIEAKNATLLAISPMLPDGTQYMATKTCLKFPVLSDIGNEVARQYKLTFVVPENIRAQLTSYGEDVPGHNGDDSWEIPLPATYIINQNQEIVWSFVDNDPGCRAEPEDIVAAIPFNGNGESKEGEEKVGPSSTRTSMASSTKSVANANSETTGRKGFVEILGRKSSKSSSLSKSLKRVFGKKKQSAGEYVCSFKVE